MENNLKADFLETLAWGKPVIQLLANCSRLAAKKPVTMVIRHSERISIEKQSEINSACLTDVGIKAARNFGQCLPKTRSIHIYHSPVVRCRDTADYICDGAKSVGIEVKAVGEMGLLEGPKTNERFWANVIRDWPHSFNYWLSGRYPPSDAESSLDYSKRVAREMENEAIKTDSNNLDLYVTHDLAIMALLFHWFGVLPSSEYTSFMNGFLMQRMEEKISLFVKDSYREVLFPFWWNK